MTNIAHYRKLRGLKQAQLAELVDVTQPHMSRIENGDDGPPLRLFKSIAAALGVSLADLFSDAMTAAELGLLDAYRHAQPKERRIILAAAEAAEDQPREDDQSATESDQG